jgi:hypothetical protein
LSQQVRQNFTLQVAAKPVSKLARRLTRHWPPIFVGGTVLEFQLRELPTMIETMEPARAALAD